MANEKMIYLNQQSLMYAKPNSFDGDALISATDKERRILLIHGGDMEMTLSDFSKLTQNEQIDCLYQYGTYQGKCSLASGSRILYQMGCFYVEITYVKYRLEVRSIRCFESTGPLDPYLEPMDIEAIINCKH